MGVPGPGSQGPEVPGPGVLVPLLHHKAKEKVLSDGGTVGGKGRLTDAATDTLQKYYGAAIPENQNNLVSIKSVFWTIHYHSILGDQSELLDEQHRYYPKSSISWCHYQADQISNTCTHNQSRCPVYLEKR